MGYVVIASYKYEGDDLKGVYDDYEQAMVKARQIKAEDDADGSWYDRVSVEHWQDDRMIGGTSL